MILLWFLLSCASKDPTENGMNGQIEVARQLVSAAEYNQALSILSSLSKKYPENSEIMSLLGFAYLGNQNYENSFIAFGSAAKSDDKNQEHLLNQSYASILMKNTKNARVILDKILKKGTYVYMEKVYLNYGLAYMEEGQCTLAQPYFNRSLQLDPTFVPAHFNTGQCYLNLKNYPLALKSFKKAASFCPMCPDPLLRIAKTQFLLGHRSQAKSIVQDFLKKKPSPSLEKEAKMLLRSMEKGKVQ